ncbi:MAG: hypothetical protein KJ574_03755, partial [Nanoarchaeota archaeon]|nr:hypothetical protein [Nanoarchaeota archaeon]
MDKAKLEIGETTPKLFLDFFYISHGDILGSIAIDALDVLPIATPLSHQDEFRLQQRGVNTRRVKSRDFQNMSAPDNILMRAGNVWQDYAAIAGVGQFSLVNQSPFSVLAKVMVYKRNASPEEVQEDFEIFGERVVGNPLKNLSEERREGKPYIEVHGEKFLY